MEIIETIYDFSSGTIQCRGCGIDIKLWFNGGEGDIVSHCDYTYDSRATDSPEKELTIYKKQPHEQT